MADFSDSEIRVRDAKGKQQVLRYNEPRPDLGVKPRPDRMVEAVEGLAGLRLRVEQILDHNCGEDHTERLIALGPEAARVLLKVAATGGCNRRAGAVTALGYFPHAETADFLTRLVSDASEDLVLRVRAAVSLGQIGSSSAVAGLSTILEKDPSPPLRRAAAKGLTLSRSLQAVAALDRAASKDRDNAVRLEAYNALRALEKIHGERLTSLSPPKMPERRKAVRKQISPPRADSRSNRRK